MTARERITMRTMAWGLVRPASCLLVPVCATSPRTTTGRFEVEEDGGFTITEEVRFSSGVRRDFEEAMRLLEEERNEEGIELLEGVTAAAPDATMAHIDLGIA